MYTHGSDVSNDCYELIFYVTPVNLAGNGTISNITPLIKDASRGKINCVYPLYYHFYILILISSCAQIYY